MPLSVAGFGAVQGVWVLAYEKWAPGEQILAFQFLWALMTAFAALVRGLPFVKGVLGEMQVGGGVLRGERGPEEIAHVRVAFVSSVRRCAANVGGSVQEKTRAKRAREVPAS